MSMVATLVILQRTIVINSCPDFSNRFHIQFDFDIQSCFREKYIYKKGHIHAVSPSAGVDFANIKFSIKKKAF